MQSEHDALTTKLRSSTRSRVVANAELRPDPAREASQISNLSPEALDALKELARMIARQLAREGKK
jgi:hypothetical protein